MRETTFQEYLHGTARHLGWDPARDLWTTAAARLGEYIQKELDRAWRFDFWREWTITERRRYRAVWDASTVYAVGDQVFYVPTGKYYQAIEANDNENPIDADNTNLNSTYWWPCASSYTSTTWRSATSYSAKTDVVVGPLDGEPYLCRGSNSDALWTPSNWVRLIPFQKYIAWEQTGQTPIDAVKRATQRDPRVYPTRPGVVPHAAGDAGVNFRQDAPNEVYLQFLKRPPVITTTVYSATTSYAAGEAVYSAPHCYVALQATTGQTPATATDYWQRQALPQVLAPAVMMAAAANVLEEQNQMPRRDRLKRSAADALEEELAKQLAGSTDAESVKVSTYGS